MPFRTFWEGPGGWRADWERSHGAGGVGFQQGGKRCFFVHFGRGQVAGVLTGNAAIVLAGSDSSREGNDAFSYMLGGARWLAC